MEEGVEEEGVLGACVGRSLSRGERLELGDFGGVVGAVFEVSRFVLGAGVACGLVLGALDALRPPEALDLAGDELTRGTARATLSLPPVVSLTAGVSSSASGLPKSAV